MKRFAALILVLALAGCTTTSPDVVQRNDAQRLSSVVDATVLSVRPVTVEGTQSGLGSVAGGLVKELRATAALKEDYAKPVCR